MIRVHVICEGQTEEMFVKELLKPSLEPLNIHLLPSLIGKPGHKGGNFKFQRLHIDVRNRLLQDKECFCTTFFDFYGLPADFPGKVDVQPEAELTEKANAVKEGMLTALTNQLGDNVMRRFIPYVQMYEFEALLFSDPKLLAEGIGRPELEETFDEISDSYDTPEHINDSPITAPSKRLLANVHGYEKPIMGNLAALEIGLTKMREKCCLFNNWVNQLEALSE